jgi:hypothetical protein
MKSFISEQKKGKADVLECWEYHTKDSIMLIVAGKFMVKKHWTPFKENKLPYYIVTSFPETRTPYGLALVEMIYDSLEYINTVMNANADNMDLALQRMWLIKSYSDIPFNKLESGPGKVYKVSAFDDMTPVPTVPLNPESYREIGTHTQFANDVAGNPDTPQAASTATEAKLSALNFSSKIRESIKYNREEFLIPFLRSWINLNQQFLTKEDAVSLLGSKKAKELAIETKNVDWNVDLDVELTGEASDVDRLLELDKFSQFVNLIVAASKMPTGLSQSLVYKQILTLFNYPNEWLNQQTDQIKDTQEQQAQQPTEGQPAQPTNGPTQADAQAIKSEIEAAAKSAGVPPQQFLANMAEKMQVDVASLLKSIMAAGSFDKFAESILKNVQQ